MKLEYTFLWHTAVVCKGINQFIFLEEEDMLHFVMN